MRKPKPTIDSIGKKLKRRGAKSLTAADAETLARLQRAAERKKKIIPFPRARFDIARELKSIVPEVFRSYVDLLRNGKGIAKKQAADALKAWADEFIDENVGRVSIRFDPVGVPLDEDNDPAAESA